ncbi:MAG: chromate transporter [Chloroflexi bacterium]|nr:chromate transporter [Chloroflexota bacterium]
MSVVLTFLLFLKASALAFGGLGSLPILHQDLVARGVQDVDGMVGAALAVARITPGPNGLWLVALGYLLGRTPGAVAASVALAIPPFLILLIMASYGKISHFKRTERALLFLSLGLSGLLGFTSWQIVRGSSPTVLEWAVAAGGFLGVSRFNVHPFLLLCGAGILGVVLARLGLAF